MEKEKKSEIEFDKIISNRGSLQKRNELAYLELSKAKKFSDYLKFFKFDLTMIFTVISIILLKIIFGEVVFNFSSFPNLYDYIIVVPLYLISFKMLNETEFFFKQQVQINEDSLKVFGRKISKTDEIKKKLGSIGRFFHLFIALAIPVIYFGLMHKGI